MQRAQESREQANLVFSALGQFRRTEKQLAVVEGRLTMLRERYLSARNLVTRLRNRPPKPLTKVNNAALRMANAHFQTLQSEVQDLAAQRQQLLAIRNMTYQIIEQAIHGLQPLVPGVQLNLGPVRASIRQAAIMRDAGVLRRIARLANHWRKTVRQRQVRTAYTGLRRGNNNRPALQAELAANIIRRAYKKNRNNS